MNTIFPNKGTTPTRKPHESSIDRSSTANAGWLPRGLAGFCLLVFAQACLGEFEVIVSPEPDSPEHQYVWRVDPGEWYQLETAHEVDGTWEFATEFLADGPIFTHGHGDDEHGFYRLARVDRCPPDIVSYFPYDDAFSVDRYST